MATAKSAALTAPARPIAMVATGTPAGIWTMESSESSPLSARLWMGTPIDGQQRVSGDHAGQMRRAARAGDDHFKAASFGVVGIFHHPIRGAMGGDDAAFVRHVEVAQRLGGMAHGFPVGLAAHDDADRAVVAEVMSDAASLTGLPSSV